MSGRAGDRRRRGARCIAAAALLLAALAGCAATTPPVVAPSPASGAVAAAGAPPPSDDAAAPAQAAAPLVAGGWALRDPTRDPPQRPLQVLLVAGSDDVANFAQEVVEQRALWLRQGIDPNAIGCYVAPPSAAAWRADRAQLEALTADVRGCWPAEWTLIQAHLAEAAAAEPAWVYLYISTHGVPTLRPYTRRALGPDERSWIDQHAIGVVGGDGPALEAVDRALDRARAGEPRDALIVTAGALTRSLAPLPARTRKLVVIQACFSGGLVRPRRSDIPGLASVPNLHVLAAARRDRPSFGCDPGEERTYFGGAVGAALAAELRPGQSPADVAWEAVFERARAEVERRERKLGARPSHPQRLDTGPPLGPPAPP